MYKTGGYRGDDRMCDLVCDRYPVLQVMSRFGIALGFGDRTIAEVCAESGVDTATFLAVVDLLLEGDSGREAAGEVSVRALPDYLRNSHAYFLDFRLPGIRRKLIEALDARSDAALAIMRFFDDYVGEVRNHMDYEEQTVFPYVEALLAGERRADYSMDVFRSQHDGVDVKLCELKNILIKYYPAAGSSNELNGVLFDLFTCEQELASHKAVEDEIFAPAVERLAADGATHPEARPEPLSAREKEVIVGVVRGLTNKQIADELCISTHTVITHRRNIAAKLQIHSAAGLTIYAIVNKLVELSEIQETIAESQP